MKTTVHHLRQELRFVLEQLNKLNDADEIDLGIDRGNHGVEYLQGTNSALEFSVLKRMPSEDSHEFLIVDISLFNDKE